MLSRLERRRGVMRWPWIVAAAVIGVVVLVVVVVFYRNTHPSTLSVNEGLPLAEQFLELIRQGKPDEAWAVTSAEFKSIMGKESFRALVKAKPALRGPAKFQTLRPVEKSELNLAAMVFKPEKGTQQIVVTLGCSAGKWQVEALSFE